MFALDSTYNIVFLAVACGVTAFLLAGCIATAVLHTKKLGAGGIVYVVFDGILSFVLLVLTATIILYKLDVITVENGALNLWGLLVPELGRIIVLMGYTVSEVLLGAAIVCGILGIVLQFTREPRPVLDTIPEEVVAAEEEVAKLEQTIEEQNEVPEEVAAAQEEVAKLEQTIDEQIEETIDEEPQEKDTDEEPLAEEGADAPVAEETTDEEPAEEEGQEEPFDAAADVLGDMPEYRPQKNVYRDLVGQLSDVLDDALEEVKPEVVRMPREKRVTTPKEVVGEEIKVPLRTINRTGDAPAAKKTVKKATVERRAVAPDASLMTRRHVIINRSNVANMFSEYLKNRNEEEKERLEGSINTIILK